MDNLTMNEIYIALDATGLEYAEDFGPSPTEFWVWTPDGTRVLFAHGFNREDGGWEAEWRCNLEDACKAEGLDDGPHENASAQEVVDWVARLVADPRAAVR